MDGLEHGEPWDASDDYDGHAAGPRRQSVVVEHSTVALRAPQSGPAAAAAAAAARLSERIFRVTRGIQVCGRVARGARSDRARGPFRAFIAFGEAGHAIKAD